MFVLGVGQSIEFALMPMLGRELGLDKLLIDMPALGIHYYPKELAITVLASVTALSFSLFAPFWGRLSDSVGRKPIIVLGLVGNSVGVLLFSFVAWLGLGSLISGFTLFAALFAVRTIHSAMKAAAYPSITAYVIDSSSILGRTKALSGLSASTQVGTMCGPVLTFLVVVHFLAPLWLMGALTAALALLIFMGLSAPDSNIAEVEVVDASKPKPLKPLRYLDRRYRVFVLLCFLIYTSMGMVQQTLGFYFQDILQLTAIQAAKQYSLSMVVSSFAMLVAQLGVVQRISWHPIKFIIAGLPCLLIGFLMLGFAKNVYGLWLGMGLFGFALGLIGPSLSSAASQKVEAREQGGLSGIIASVCGLGFVFGPVVGGLIYSFQPKLTYFFAALIIFVLLLVIFIRNFIYSNKGLAKV